MPRLGWASIAAGGMLIVVAGLLPGFEVHVQASIGADDEQRALPDITRTYSLLGYGHARYLAVVVLALVVTAVGAYSAVRPQGNAALAIVLVCAVGGLALLDGVIAGPTGTGDRAFLSEGIEQVRKDAERTPAARDPEYEICCDSHGKQLGWRLTIGALWTLILIAGVGLGRRVALPWWTALAAAGAALVLLGVVPSANCGGSETAYVDASTHPLGGLAVFGALALAAVGVGALTVRRWMPGAVAAGGGAVIALVAALVLAAKDCSFY